MGGLFKPKAAPAPTVQEVKTPVVNQEVVDRSAADVMRRRRGSNATITGASGMGSTAGSVAGKTLLGE
ncbi:MAG: hypothetical protein RL375_4176 [Pseudomonadota bacterium]|jgi:hypothetical protein